MLSAVLATALIGIIILFLIIWKRNSTFRELIDRIPGPKGIPVFGNSFQMGQGGAAFYRSLIKLAGVYREAGMFRVWIGHLAVIVVYTPENLEVILSSSKNTKKSIFYDALRQWLQDGLLMSYGAKWFSRRKLLTPTFHYSILEQFVEVFHQKSSKLVTILSKASNGKPIDISPYITNCTLDIICETAMGVEMNAQESSQSAYILALHRVSDIISDRMKQPWLYNDTIFSLTALGREHKKILHVLHSFTRNVINERWFKFIQQRNLVKRTTASSDSDSGTTTTTTTTTVNGQDIDGHKEKRLAFLDILLACKADTTTGNALTLDDVQEEVDTFMFEGHDTTSSAITWALYHLAVNQDCQERARAEINAIIDSETTASIGKLNELKYLEGCIKESMRLIPTVAMISREITEECRIGGYVVPIGATVSLMCAIPHRDPRYFPDPDSFNPDRWLEDDVAKRHAYAYTPFSAGIRNCIGQKFAMLEQKVVLSHILPHFKISCDQTLEEIDPESLLIIRPAAGLFLTMTRIV